MPTHGRPGWQGKILRPRLARKRRSGLSRKPSLRHPDFFVALLSLQGTDEGARLKADRGGDVQKLEHVKPPVAELIFCHVGRRLAEPLRDGRLRQAGRLAPGFEQRAQLFVPFGMDGLGQSEGLRCAGFRSNSLWRILPKWEKITLISGWFGAGMSPQSWGLWPSAIVLAAPFALFFILLMLVPPAAGWFAGVVLARITDPPILIGIFLAGIVGTARRHFAWALGIGLLIGAAGSLLGYSWWSRVAGNAVAADMAARFVVWAILLAAYGYVAGQVLIEACERLAKPASPNDAQVYPRRDSEGTDKVASNNSPVFLSVAASGVPRADYYPLISRAVTGLDTSTKDSRASLYERARAAQLNELRKRDPPISNAELEAECLALENAIRTVEIDIAIKRALALKADQPREVGTQLKLSDHPSPIKILLEESCRTLRELADLRKLAPALYINLLLFGVFAGPPLIVLCFIDLMDGETTLHYLLSELLWVFEQLAFSAFSLLLFFFVVFAAVRTLERLKVRR